MPLAIIAARTGVPGSIEKLWKGVVIIAGMNHANLPATKFFTPVAPPQVVERPQLLVRITAVAPLRHALTLVSAPAGYGKSTFVSQWLRQQPHPFAWLSLDPTDDQPGRFFTCFVAALRRIDDSFATDLFATLQAGQLPPPDTLVATLINELLTWESPRILVLDDFHHVQDPTILDTLATLISQQLPNFHLVLATREDPPLPLARWRARGQLAELRAADLRFSETEADRFLRGGLQLPLSAAEVARLTERTEGWAAGLQLAGISLQKYHDPAMFVQTLSGAHRFILDYLTEEALKTQPADVQVFLLETAILPRLTGELCDAVTGRNDSASLLERLLAANLFIIPLDDEGRWYRYHHLFAELLQHRLHREGADRLPELHRRASLWHEQQNMPGPTIEHALAAGDYNRALAALEKYHWQLLTQGYARALTQWAAALPEDLRYSSASINATIVWSKILQGDYVQARAYLAAAQTAVNQLSPDAPHYQALQADVLALQSFIVQAQGQQKEALALAAQARSLAPPDDLRLIASTSLAFGVACRLSGQFTEAVAALEQAMRAAHAIEDHITAMIAVAHLSLIWYPLGRLRLLAETAEFAIERAERIARIAPVMIGSVHAVLGLVYYEWDQVEKARTALLHAIQLATLSGQPASLVYARVHLARLYQGEGNLEAAAQQLRQAGQVLAQGGPAWARPDWTAQQVSLLLAQGNLAEAATILTGTGIFAETPVTYRTEVIHLAWLRWLIADRQAGALLLAERIVESAGLGGRNGTLIQALLLGAKAGGGMAWLARARQLAAPEGYRRIFLDEAIDEASMRAQALVEPLTERELEVLRLLAAGLSYAQVAAKLVVSVNTVRYHVKGLYGKLGVEKQMQAVERGRELGLL